jgi:hypothetical protein
LFVECAKKVDSNTDSFDVINYYDSIQVNDRRLSEDSIGEVIEPKRNNRFYNEGDIVNLECEYCGEVDECSEDCNCEGNCNLDCSSCADRFEKHNNDDESDYEDDN